MKLFSLIVASGVTALSAAPALAGPYVSTKTEFKGTDADYSSTVNQARLGYDWKMGDFTPYVELGGGLKSPDGGESDTFTAAELGTSIKLTQQLSAKLKAEVLSFDDKDSWKVELSTKYRF